MLLKITRRHKKGLMGGLKFVLTARAQITPEEREHVATHHLGSTILWDMEDINPRAVAEAGWLKRLTKTYTIFVSTLVNGTEIECETFAEMLAHEAALKNACYKFKSVLDAAAKFGTEELITIGEPEPPPPSEHEMVLEE